MVHQPILCPELVSFTHNLFQIYDEDSVMLIMILLFAEYSPKEPLNLDPKFSEVEIEKSSDVAGASKAVIPEPTLAAQEAELPPLGEQDRAEGSSVQLGMLPLIVMHARIYFVLTYLSSYQFLPQHYQIAFKLC